MKGWMIAALAAAAGGLFGTQACAHEHHAHPVPANGNGKTELAQGVVYHDQNGNRRRDPGEPGVAEVKVSNGLDIVRTDAEGRYQIKVTDDTIIFVIKPRGWALPLNQENLPQFYYIHKPNGSPPEFQFPGVAATGPLPASVDFPMTRQEEPDQFKALLFGDTQPRDVREVEYMTHDVIEQIIAADGHDASFGVTLGDIVFDDLSVMKPLNQAIALIGIPWYNVIGNHDLNFDAANDQQSDETFERIYGPSYYSFDYGPTHFLVLDDVTWVAQKGDEKAHYYGGLGERQLAFIRKDLELIPEDQLVVLMMHIPLTGVEDRQQLYRLIEQRPATVSLSAHTHYMEHRLIGDEDGWRGAEPHEHIINVTVCGSWWRGQPDERGIPHATMSDGGPNGYSLMSFDGNEYAMEFFPASRPADYQMNIYAPEAIAPAKAATTVVMANVFAADTKTTCRMRIAGGPWRPMQRITVTDPGYLAEKAREEAIPERGWRELPGPHATPNMYRAMLPAPLPEGTHKIEVEAVWGDGRQIVDHRLMRVEQPASTP
jgi:hypothetical protein